MSIHFIRAQASFLVALSHKRISSTKAKWEKLGTILEILIHVISPLTSALQSNLERISLLKRTLYFASVYILLDVSKVKTKSIFGRKEGREEGKIHILPKGGRRKKGEESEHYLLVIFGMKRRKNQNPLSYFGRREK